MASEQSLQDLADAATPLRPRGVAVIVICCSAIFLSLAIVVVALRVYCRLWKRRSLKAWGWEDLLAVLALVPYAGVCVYSPLACFYSLGARPEEVDLGKLLRGVQYGLRGEVCYVFAIALIKTSVGLGLLRIAIQRRYRQIIISIIFCVNFVYIASLICIFVLCTSLWKAQMVATCANAAVPYVTLMWMGMAIAAVTDAAFAIIPVILVRRLQLPRRTKHALMAVFALGGLGAVACVARFPFMWAWIDLSPDHPEALHDSAWVSLFGVVEPGVGLVAGSLPFVGTLFHFFDAPKHETAPVKMASRTIGGTPFDAARAGNPASASQQSGHSTWTVVSATAVEDGLGGGGSGEKEWGVAKEAMIPSPGQRAGEEDSVKESSRNQTGAYETLAGAAGRRIEDPTYVV